jgi:NAD(P)-dependent dehydrogenase (short-subunit alcohol dehydrogenase family)
VTGTDIGTILITGGASGLGAAVAQAVASSGGTPFVLDRQEPPFEVDHELVDLADGRAA